MITVVMTTYWPDNEMGHQRVNYAKQSLAGLLRYLTCDVDTLKLHIADDGSPWTLRQREFNKMLGDANVAWGDSTLTNIAHKGIGSSLNEALSCVEDMWFYTTDDWLLTAKLNLDGPVKLLTSGGYDLVRLGPIHPNLTCVTRFDQSIGWWLDIHQHYGGFAFATRPFIATKGFYDKVGPFDEMLNSYETERLYAERVARSTSKLAYWGGVDLAGPFVHLGTESIGSYNVVGV